MRISEIEVERLSKKQITKILFGEEQDDGKHGDCIFVYGGKGIERVDKAVDLYKQKRADYILFSGGIKYGKYTTSEAITMKNNALKKDVPAKAILTEELSNNTKENVISSLFTLENKFGIHNIRHLLVVSIPWHYRRCLLSLQTYYPNWINYTWCSANYQKCQPNNWWKYSDSTRYVINEINNLVKFVKEGQLLDIEIDL